MQTHKQPSPDAGWDWIRPLMFRSMLGLQNHAEIAPGDAGGGGANGQSAVAAAIAGSPLLIGDTAAMVWLLWQAASGARVVRLAVYGVPGVRAVTCAFSM